MASWFWLSVLAVVLLIALVYSIAMPGRRKKKVAVFDLDETLGSFTQLGLLKDVIEGFENQPMTQSEFNNLIDENPEFVRPGVIDILRLAVSKRAKGHCDAIMIYTNNNGPRSWPDSISKYFSYRLGQNVFDQVIYAYRINGRQVEAGRTTHDKTYADFLRCTGMPDDTQVCFFDDVFHPQMKHNNVFYINAKGYSNIVPLETSIRRRYRGDLPSQSKAISYAKRVYGDSSLRGKPKSPEEQELDVVVGKFMLKNAYEFFGPERGGTRRKRGGSCRNVNGKRSRVEV